MLSDLRQPAFEHSRAVVLSGPSAAPRSIRSTCGPLSDCSGVLVQYVLVHECLVFGSILCYTFDFSIKLKLLLVSRAMRYCMTDGSTWKRARLHAPRGLGPRSVCIWRRGYAHDARKQFWSPHDDEPVFTHQISSRPHRDPQDPLRPRRHRLPMRQGWWTLA